MAAGLELGEVAFSRVFDEQALVAAIVGFAHRGLHTDFGRHAGEHKMGDSLRPQRLVQAGRPEHALARLVDDDLAGDGRQIRRRSGCPARQRRGCGPSRLHRRCGGPACRATALPAGNRRGPACAPRGCGRPASPCRRNSAISAATVGTMAVEPGDVVAKRVAEAALLDEVALHVDDDERHAGRVERRSRRGGPGPETSSLSVPPYAGRSCCGRCRRSARRN